MNAAKRVSSPGRASVPQRGSGRRPVHPGEFLRTRYLDPLGISQQELARKLGISRRRVNELVRGRRGMTPDTAIRLGLHFHTEPGFWMELQTAWDMHQAWQRFRDGLNPSEES